MKKWHIIGIIFFAVMLVTLTACSSLGGSGSTASQWSSETRRGDIRVTVSGSGNLQVASEAKLTFGSGGKVKKIYVEEGDLVKKGAALAALDTDTLQISLSQAELNQAQADLAISQAQLGEMQANVAVSQAELAKTQAEVSIEAAKFDLDRMKDVEDIKDDIDKADLELKNAEVQLKMAVESKAPDIDFTYWSNRVLSAKITLLELQQDLADLLGENEYASLQVDEVKIKALRVKAAEDSLSQAIITVEQAKKNLEQAKKSTEYAVKSLDFTKMTVIQAQKQLAEATITAPFDGLVVAVNADEGDIIASPSVSPKTIIHVIDLSSMELEVEVDEIDIPKVKAGQKVSIALDAFPDAHYTGTVTSIASLPSPQAGVILYKVKIGFKAPPDSGIKVSMSADADIILQESINALLIPSRAVSTSQGNAVVSVVSGNRTEERAVTTGLSDGFDTEILSGLNDGEIVVVENKAKTGGGLFQ